MAAKRTLLKDHLILGKELAKYAQQRARNISKNGRGVGRLDDSVADCFVLTRVLNHPELMFNQRPHLDKDLANRFFKVDAEGQWRLLSNTECYICNRY